MTAKDTELCKYVYAYGAPIHTINSIENTGDINVADENDYSPHDIPARLVRNTERQKNKARGLVHSLLRKRLMNLYAQDNYVIKRSMMSNPSLLRSGLGGERKVSIGIMGWT